MTKISRLEDGEWMACTVPAVYAMPTEQSPVQRIVAGASTKDRRVFRALVRILESPMFLLYVLHTPRGEGDAGRYQSPALSRADVESFLARFEDYLCTDARFDLWVHSPAKDATVVWDRHDVIHAYGPLAHFEREMLALGFEPGALPQGQEHAHHYRAECDDDACAVLAAFDWTRTELKPADEQ